MAQIGNINLPKADPRVVSDVLRAAKDAGADEFATATLLGFLGIESGGSAKYTFYNPKVAQYKNNPFKTPRKNRYAGPFQIIHGKGKRDKEGYTPNQRVYKRAYGYDVNKFGDPYHQAQVVLNYIEKKRRKYGDKPIRIYLNWQQGGGGSRYIFTRSRLDTPIGDPSFNPKIRRNIKSNFRNWERYGLSSADEITPRMFINRFKRRFNSIVTVPSKKELNNLEKDIEQKLKQTEKVPSQDIPGVADSIASLSTGAGVATVAGEKERTSKGSFLRKFKWFKTKYPQFNFDTFYEKIESLPGGVDKYLPRFEKDYVFGPEHFTAWNKISNMANSSTVVQAQSGSKPTKIKTIVRKTNKDVTACDPKNLEPVPNKSSAGRRYIDAQCANNVYKGPVPGYVGKRSAKWFNLHKAVKQLLWLYCTRNVRVIFGVAGEQHRNVRKAVDFVKKNYGITDLRYEKGTWGSFDRLAEILKSNEPVYIHCTWGVHRSSTVLAGALMINNGLCFDEAIRCADLRFKNFSGGENHKYVKRLKKLQDKLISSGVLSVDCKKESLTENKEWNNLLDEMIDADDVKIKGLSVKNNLDPEIWKNSNQLKDYIADNLYKIAKNFFENLEIDWKLVKDITITGSIANYNWSSYSDIDLHILVDFRKVDENEKLVKDFFKNATMNWNRNHKITVKDHEVELYVQDSREPHHSTGVYSVKYDRWIKTPSKFNPQMDYENVKKKVAKIMNDIDEVYELFAEKKYKQAYDEADDLRGRIYKFRKSGLEKGGEYSVENLTFKVLRRNNYLNKLRSLKIMSYDNMMTINGGNSSEIIKVNLKESN